MQMVQTGMALDRKLCGAPQPYIKACAEKQSIFISHFLMTLIGKVLCMHTCFESGEPRHSQVSLAICWGSYLSAPAILSSSAAIALRLFKTHVAEPI